LPETRLKATQQLLSVVEWLFHALQDENMDEGKLRTALREHVNALSEGGPGSSVADLIADEIERDTEVRYLIRHRLGDDGVSTVRAWLRT
jgi:hypothetical protein